MDAQLNQVNFAFHRIAALQFAILDGDLPKDAEVFVSTMVNFGLGPAERIAGIKSIFQFESEKKVFLKLEVCCEFIIEEGAWKSFIQDDGRVIVFPKGLMMHLTTLLVGTARGILHSKTENSAYNRFILPTINVTELVTDDIQMELMAPPVAQ